MSNLGYQIVLWNVKDRIDIYCERGMLLHVVLRLEVT